MEMVENDDNLRARNGDKLLLASEARKKLFCLLLIYTIWLDWSDKLSSIYRSYKEFYIYL